jgi:glycosyltransferase involved in cell wall biosynthesis
MTRPSRWICAQLGSREHYAIPRVLHSDGRLEHLLTDFWATPRWLWTLVPGRRLAAARGRWHPALNDARVHGLGLTRLVFDASNRQRGWERTIRRNDWFQRQHLAWLSANKETLAAGPRGIFFAYSYAARELFRFFKGIGWKTVLGQIDPGPREEMIVAEEAARFPESRGGWTRAPGDYWSSWREELSLADKIVVNSEWSLECLRLDGVSAEKMLVVPLAFESTRGAKAHRAPPPSFTKDRPLRVLFLGQVNMRKGAHHLLEAAGRLVDSPIEFNFVGPVEISRPGAVSRNVRWHGPVSREETAQFYSAADVFALPTLSDGFALTQLEALSRGVPVMVTRNCGRVVENGRNGWILPSPSADDITDALRRLATSPSEVAACASGAHVPESFSLEGLRGSMDRIEQTFK